MPTEGHNYSHENQVDKTQRHEVFPLKLQYLIDTQTGKGPTHPHEQPYYSEGLTKEPYDARNSIQNAINSHNADVERCPTTKEYCGGNA